MQLHFFFQISVYSYQYLLFNTYMESKAWFTNPRSLSSSISTTLSSWSSNSFFSSIGNFLSLNEKSPSRIDCIYLIWTDSSDRPDITDKNIVFCFTAFPNFTPLNSSYTVVNPSGWRLGKCELVTSIHPRWQNQYFQPCFADKFVTEITILHEKAAMKLSSLPLKMSVSYRNRTHNRVLGARDTTVNTYND